MNRIVLVITLVSALAVVASARGGHGNGRALARSALLDDEFAGGDFETLHGGLGGFHRSPFEGIRDEFLIEELARRGHGFGRFGGIRGRSGRFNRRLLRNGGLGLGGGEFGGLGSGFGGAGLGGAGLGGAGLGGSGLGGAGLGGGLGAAGLRGSEAAGLAAGEGSGFREGGSVSGKAGALLADRKNLDVDRAESSHSDAGAIHKHQVLNKDKTIIKDRTTGVNDVDGFHVGHGQSDSNHLGVGSSKVGAIGGSAHADASKEVEQEAGFAAGGEKEGAAGAAGAAGGAFI